MKKVIGVLNAPGKHWVGDGFHVHSMFNYQQHAQLMSPFLLMDYGSKEYFSPRQATQQRRGVGPHPHRGFETVTIVYHGEVAHRDSTGKGGVIGPGDVQWMTAGSGILHEEYHSEKFSAEGGDMQMVQLWVNLPAKDKMTAPGYQGIVDSQIPAVDLPDDAGKLRVIAGEYGSQSTRSMGPAHTHTPMNVWDLRLNAGKTLDLSQPEGWMTAIVLLSGELQVNAETALKPSQMVVLTRDGTGITVQAAQDSTALLLAGQPINEPVAGYGPFVMNSEMEIRQAITDFNSGKFGVL